MKIYTRTGDTGETGLFGGLRVSKASDRVSTYGTLDELNACVGVARAAGLAPEIDAVLATVQSELFTLGAELATAPGKEDKLGIARLDEASVAALEAAIDAADAALPPLKTFVLPGGSAGAAALHLARTVCRRAERELVALMAHEPVRLVLVHYLNRLSDLLFTQARLANLRAGVDDVPWAPRKSTP
ncbi:MAG: cob(I)yrinic acid a,c-diamide adenosyltransferase [Myxococcales bacterium]|nr:cob(I)yrinic acid a,c-diamide adenosyltransferase [Myxococcales bacterium]